MCRVGRPPTSFCSCAEPETARVAPCRSFISMAKREGLVARLLASARPSRASARRALRRRSRARVVVVRRGGGAATARRDAGRRRRARAAGVGPARAAAGAARGRGAPKACGARRRLAARARDLGRSNSRSTVSPVAPRRARRRSASRGRVAGPVWRPRGGPAAAEQSLVFADASRGLRCRVERGGSAATRPSRAPRSPPALHSRRRGAASCASAATTSNSSLSSHAVKVEGGGRAGVNGEAPIGSGARRRRRAPFPRRWRPALHAATRREAPSSAVGRGARRRRRQLLAPVSVAGGRWRGLAARGGVRVSAVI